MRTRTIPAYPDSSTARQQFLRRHACNLPLRNAVRFAADACFRFSGRGMNNRSLWSEAERVWLGPATFLHWAMWLEEINIPWTVATAAGAPQDAQRLHDAVHAELLVYWDDQMASLPSQKCPQWLPLP